MIELQSLKDIIVAGLISIFLIPSFAKVYVSWGWHGGYYLTNEEGTQSAFDSLFRYLSVNPNLKAVLELEPYTIERMLLGERFYIEKQKRGEGRIRDWSWGGVGEWRFACGKEYAHSGSVGVRLNLESGEWVNLCQQRNAVNLQGKTLLFSGWIRAHRGEGAHLYIDAWDASSFIPGSSRFSSMVPPDGNWYYVEIEFPVPYGAVTIFPQAKIDSQPGYADFDDLSLRVIETGEELLINGGFEEMFVPSLKDETRLSKLRELVNKGQIEIVGGAYSQPIMYTIGEEAVVRQFLLGCKAVEEALGVQVKIYAAQEPCMIGQLPQILSKFGFQGVLYRTSWGAFGFVPSFDAEVVNWIGPDGTSICAIPQPNPLRIGWGAPSTPNTEIVRECERRGVKNPIFVSFGDFIDSWVNSTAPSFITGKFESGYVNICQRLTGENLRGKKLELSAWVRARKGNVHLYIDAHNAQGIAKGGTQTPDCPLDDKWHYLRLGFTVPDDAVYLFPQGRIISSGEGDADFDAFSLKDEEGKELLSYGSFETEQLPGGWGVGRSEGVEARGEIVAGDAKEGRRFVRLVMRMPLPSYESKVVTIEDYLKDVCPPKGNWVDAYKGFEHRFPFGLLAGRPQRVDRATEDEILRTERLLSLIYTEKKRSFPKGLLEKLEDAWRLLLIGHHHDAWVCAPVIFGIWSSGFKTYADLTYKASEEARSLCQSLVEELARGDWRGFNLFNLSSKEREEIANISLSLPPKVVKNPYFESMGKKLPADITDISRYPDGSVKELKAQIHIKLPPLGYRLVNLKEGNSAPIERRARAKTEGDRAILENEFLKVVISKDGFIAFNIYGEPLLSQPAHFVGHFASGEQIGRVEKVKAKNEGALAIAEAEGKIGDVPFVLNLTLSSFSPLLRVRVDFDFGKESVIGAVGEFPPLSDVPDWARDDLKLRLVLPLNFREPRFYSHCAFELREPHQKFFPFLRYAGAEEKGKGVVIYTDRATSGIFDKEDSSLSIVLAYGGNFIYAPREFAPLIGKESYEFAIYFYQGDKESAGVAQYAEEIALPIFALPANPSLGREGSSLLELSPSKAVVVSALYPTEKGIVLRIWRPYEGEKMLRLSSKIGDEIWLTDMRGNPQRKVGDKGEARLSIKRNEVLTLLIRSH